MITASFAVFVLPIAVIGIFALWLKADYVLNIVVAVDGMGNVTLYNTNAENSFQFSVFSFQFSVFRNLLILQRH
jgi:hypothetical protein